MRWSSGNLSPGRKQLGVQANFTLNTPSSECWRFTLKPQIPFSPTYQQWQCNVILDSSGKYYSVYELQDRRECGLIKTPLISSISYFNLWWLKFCLGGLVRKSTPPWRLDWIRSPQWLHGVYPMWGMEGGWYGSGCNYSRSSQSLI